MTDQNKDKQTQSTEIINKIFMISLFLQRVGNRQIAISGLNQPQFAVLGEIVRKNGLSQKDILGDFLLNKSNLSKIIKKLETMKLITVDVSRSDRRKMVLNATDTGIELYDQCFNELNELKMQFTSSLSDTEVQAISDALGRLLQLVKEQKNKTEE